MGSSLASAATSGSAQGVGPYSGADYRNGSDIETDNYTIAREAQQQMLADNRTALNAANVAADLTVEPLLQVHDLGLALGSVAYNELFRSEGDALRLPEMKSGMADAYANGASQSRLLLQSNPLTGFGVVSCDLTTATMNGDWGGVAEGAGGLVDGLAIGKAMSSYGVYGVRWAPGDIGTIPMQSQRDFASQFRTRQPGKFVARGIGVSA